MTVHIRQTLPIASDFEALVNETLTTVPRPTFYRDRLKRVLDVVLVLFVVLPVLTLLLPICALIALDGASPIYCQQRLGRGGRVFRMWKLRSMVPDADHKLEAHLQADPRARIEWNVTQKLRHDPRITRIGHIIRKSSIDELPQLWNVLRGDMSLVGPRPMMVSQRDIYPGTAYYALRPGITGFWQTSVRNESSFAERSSFDRAYLREMSLKTDLAVLFRTLNVVMHGTGY